MPGVDWQQEVERQISELTAVVVLWTVNSLNSKSVRDEARLGLNIDKLVNVLFGVAQPPFPFDRVNGLPLDGWTGREPHPGWTRLVKTIETHVVRTGSATAGSISETLARRERALSEKQAEVARFRDAFQEARSAESETTEAAEFANAALERARDQQRRVVEMRAGAVLLRAAQDELDAAAAAKVEADKALRSMRLEVAEASRSLSKATFEIDQLLSDTPARRVETSPARPRVLENASPVGVPEHEAPAPRPIRPSVASSGNLAQRKPPALGDDRPATPAQKVVPGRERLPEPAWIQALRRGPRATEATVLQMPGSAVHAPLVDVRVARIGLGLFATVLVVFAGAALFAWRQGNAGPNVGAALHTASDASDAAPAGAETPHPYQWAPSNTATQNAELDQQWKVCSGSDYKSSISACTKMLAHKDLLSVGNRAEIYSFRSRSYNHTGQYTKALYDRELEIALGTNEPQDYVALAIDYGNVGDFKSEIQSDNKALKINPHFDDALKDRAAAVRDLANMSGKS